jgi:hypothetical protein
MAALKTTPNDRSVEAFLDSIDDEKKRQDSYRILELMKQVTGEEAQMWGDSIVGFGSYHYKYASGREGDWFLTGFSHRIIFQRASRAGLHASHSSFRLKDSVSLKQFLQGRVFLEAGCQLRAQA